MVENQIQLIDFTMQIEILVFGRAKELMGDYRIMMEVEDQISLESFKLLLLERYPALGSLSNFSIALNEIYALPGDRLQDADVVAIIPPVSGG